jgi:MoxR-like ATPase
MSQWPIFNGDGEPHDGIKELPEAPPWRSFTIKEDEGGRATRRDLQRSKTYLPDPRAVEFVNTALFLRRPLMVTGKPGTGKSSLAYAVARELKLGAVLHWPITSSSTIQEGLYRYDALGRLHEYQMAGGHGSVDIGRYITLGPLGTALLENDKPRVLLIDEIDKSDIDLPNNLLNVLEDGEFRIRELTRQSADADSVKVSTYENEEVTIRSGHVGCKEFPLIFLTNNGTRDFPPAFLRRCLQLHLEPPSSEKLARIVEAHFPDPSPGELELRERLIGEFLERRDNKKEELPTDQLLNLIYLTMKGVNPERSIIEAVLTPLNAGRSS